MDWTLSHEPEPRETREARRYARQHHEHQGAASAPRRHAPLWVRAQRWTHAEAGRDSHAPASQAQVADGLLARIVAVTDAPDAGWVVPPTPDVRTERALRRIAKELVHPEDPAAVRRVEAARAYEAVLTLWQLSGGAARGGA